MSKIDLEQIFKNNLQPINFVPEITGSFSVNEKRQFINNNSELKYFTYPDVDDSLNLNEGFNNWIKKRNCEEGIDNILYYIISHISDLKVADCNPNKILNADIICFRGLLTKIMTLPYGKDHFKFCAINYKGSIYLCESKEEEIPYENMEKFSYWGYKFESYTTSYDYNVKPDPHATVMDAKEFCVMYSTQLKDINLLYGAEIDAVIASENLGETINWDRVTLIELKTNKLISHYNANQYFLRKMLKVWSQSTLAKIDTVIVGFRDNFGHIQKLKPYTTNQIPYMCKDLWNDDWCRKSFYNFLNHVKRIVASEKDCHIAHKFQVDPNVKEIIHSTVPVTNLDYHFVPKWYTTLLDNFTINKK